MTTNPSPDHEPRPVAKTDTTAAESITAPSVPDRAADSALTDGPASVPAPKATDRRLRTLIGAESIDALLIAPVEIAPLWTPSPAVPTTDENVADVALSNAVSVAIGAEAETGTDSLGKSALGQAAQRSLFLARASTPNADEESPLNVAPPRNGHKYQVLIYIRVSNERDDENYTFEGQDRKIRQMLDRIYGAGNYTLVFYADDGVSGSTGPTETANKKSSRATMLDIQNKLKTGEYDALAMYNSNRLFRSPRWLLQWMEDLFIPLKISFHSATENFDFATSNGRMMAGVLAVINGYYRDAVSDRCRDAAEQRVAEGFSLGKAPWGWLSAPQDVSAGRRRRGIVRDEEAGRHLQWMKERYQAGLNVMEVAGELNEQGVPTPQSAKHPGALWSGPVVWHMLTNPVHYGLTSRSKKHALRQGQHFPLRYWDPEELVAIEAEGARRAKNFKTNTQRPRESHPLSGLVFCHRCGKRLYSGMGNRGSRHALTGERLRYYRCRNGQMQGQPTCGDISVPGPELEGALIGKLENLAHEPQVRAILQEQSETLLAAHDEALEAERATLQRACAEVKERELRLLDRLGRGVISDEDYLRACSDMKAQAQGRQERLQEIDRTLGQRQQRQEYIEKVREALLDFPGCWARLDALERRNALSLVIENFTAERVGRDIRMHLKLVLLPEMEFTVMPKTMRGRRKATGIEGLTPGELKFLIHFRQNPAYKEISKSMGINYHNVADYARLVRQRTGIRDLTVICELAKERMNALLPNMPQGSPRSRGMTGPDGQVLGEGMKEALPLILAGATNKEAAMRLNITPEAVQGRRARLMDFFKASSTFDLRLKAIERGYLKPDGSLVTTPQALKP